MSTFEKELTSLINRHSKENESDTPDYILARYLIKCLDAFNTSVKKRDTWHSINIKETQCLII
jgi:hypothetical protein